MTEKRPENKDMWAMKSTRDIKQSLLRLLAEKPFGSIKMEEVAAEAPITRRILYKYYASKTDILDAIMKDKSTELRKRLCELHPGDMRGGVELLYDFLDTADVAYQRVFTDPRTEGPYRRFLCDYFSDDFFIDMCPDKSFHDIIPPYLASTATLYRTWKDGKGPDISFNQLTEYVADLYLRGLNGMNQ